MSRNTKRNIDQAVLSEELQRIMKERRLVTALFTTFSFDPGFFEQEVLRLFFEDEVSHLPALRTVQVEQALHGLRTRVAVYYDPLALETTSRFGPARLDFARHPVRMNACFHPKLVCLLVESIPKDHDAEKPPVRELFVVCMSANLTESGWWQNVECAHVEVLRVGERCAFKEDLAAFLKWLAPRSPAARRGEAGMRFTKRFENEAVGEIVRFIEEEAGEDYQRQRGERLKTRFLWKKPGTSLLENFAEEFKDVLRGMNLEIISPFFSQDDSAAPLEEVIRHFEPTQIRVFMPRDDDGSPKISRKLHEAVLGHDRTFWGILPEQVTSIRGLRRGVHAKLYRFFRVRPMQELWVLGSVNLTRAAWLKGGNMECLFVVERDCKARPNFLLETVEKKPDTDAVTAVDSLETEVENHALVAFSLRYDWAVKRAEAYWDGETSPTGLWLSVSGVRLGELPELKVCEWTPLGTELAESVATHLRSTSLFTVHDDKERKLDILVMEDAVQTHKPSQLERLSVADILRYWALLTSDQRNRWLESRLHDPILATSADGEALPVNVRLPKEAESLFDRAAGFFHAFHHLEKSVEEVLEKGRPSLAVARLFGRKHDSLHRLLDRLEHSEEMPQDVVDRYVITLCAKQSLRYLKIRYADFWREQRAHSGEITRRVDSLAASLRTEILAQGEQATFLDWFEQSFLKRAVHEERGQS